MAAAAKREDLKLLVNELPDYFFDIPASSTGKYHPDFAKSEHGLVKHTKVAVRFAKELLDNPGLNNFSDNEKDIIIMAIVLHDGCKSGRVKEKYTRFDHPILIADYIMDNEEELGLEVEEIEFLCDAVKTHMGSWTTDYNGVEVLEKPKTKYQNFVHMCDYLASRKCLLVPFDKNDDISV